MHSDMIATQQIYQIYGVHFSKNIESGETQRNLVRLDGHMDLVEQKV